MGQPNDFKIDVIGVGAPKCGTTWLATCLDEHPALCLAHPTALNYFCEQTIWPEFRAPSGLGQDWLVERFAHCRPEARRVEISPNYLYDEKAAGRIHQHNPAARLIFTFRHPVDLVTSFYYQIAKESLVPPTVQAFLREYPEVRRIGLYHRYLQSFLRLFPKEQCHFILFDDVQTDPAGVVRRTYEFLEVAAGFQPPSLTRRVNERKIPRSRALLAMLNWFRHGLQRTTSPRLWHFLVWKLRLYRWHEWLLQRNLKATAPQTIDEKVRGELLDFYREDTRALASFLGRDLSHWER